MMGYDEHGPAYPGYECDTCGCTDMTQYLRCNHPMCPDGRDFVRRSARTVPPHQSARDEAAGWPLWARAMIWAAVFGALLPAVFGALLWLFTGPAPAMDHGFDPEAKATKWFESLLIPPKDEITCCGKSEAYPVDHFEKQPDGNYRVWIADGSAVQYPDGKWRIPWDESVPIDVPARLVNKMEDDFDNPTEHGWLFFVPESVFSPDGAPLIPSTKVVEIYCFVRHPRYQ